MSERWRDDIWPLHGECEQRSVSERRFALIAEIAQALHRNVCDPVHEQLGPWDTEQATDLVQCFEDLMAAQDDPAGFGPAGLADKEQPR